MPNYSKGKIYSIRFYDNDKLIYIGSTIQSLAVRFGGHKRNIDCSLYQYIKENYNEDFKCCYMELLEPYECNNKNELEKKEGEIIRQFKADINYIVINKLIAGRTKKEYYQDNADKIKEKQNQYYQDNHDKMKETQQEYYYNNVDKFKQYYEDNVDKIKEYQKQYQKQYRQNKKNEIKS
jgi:hypothetical protein